MVAKSARLVAPVALAAVAVATYVIVQSGLSTHQPTSAQSSAAQTPTGTVGGRRHHRLPKYYFVKQGDTLSQISVRTHVTILELTDLNPGLNPNTLQTGQRLRLRR